MDCRFEMDLPLVFDHGMAKGAKKGQWRNRRLTGLQAEGNIGESLNSQILQ